MSGKSRNKKGKKKKNSNHRHRDINNNKGKSSDQTTKAEDLAAAAAAPTDTKPEIQIDECCNDLTPVEHGLELTVNLETPDYEESSAIKDKDSSNVPVEEKCDFTTIKTEESLINVHAKEQSLSLSQETKILPDGLNDASNSGDVVQSMHIANKNIDVEESSPVDINLDTDKFLSNSNLSREPPLSVDVPKDKTSVLTADEKSENTKIMKVKKSPPFSYMKHPLQYTWTLWMFKPDTSGNVAWEKCQKKILSVDTIEDFWGLYHYTCKPSELRLGYDYSLFKDGIKPMWEDPKNKDGGRWIMQFDKARFDDNIWLELLMLLIGEGFGDNGKEVCGAVFNKRKVSNKIGVWLKDYCHEKENKEIAIIVKEFLNIRCPIAFTKHSSNKKPTMQYSIG